MGSKVEGKGALFIGSEDKVRNLSGIRLSVKSRIETTVE